MIISLVNQKGGVGKTTIAINLAYSISRKKISKTLLIDADPQASCSQVLADSDSFNVVHHPETDFHKGGLGELAKGYRDVVIDSPPGTSDITLSILLASNLAIVPITPSPLDILSSDEIGDIIKEARTHNKKLRAKLLVSRKIIGTTPGREAREALQRYRMGIFETEISQRIAYVKALIAGQSVLEYEPNSEAATEIRHLCDEITL